MDRLPSVPSIIFFRQMLCSYFSKGMLFNFKLIMKWIFGDTPPLMIDKILKFYYNAPSTTGKGTYFVKINNAGYFILFIL